MLLPNSQTLGIDFHNHEDIHGYGQLLLSQIQAQCLMDFTSHSPRLNPELNRQIKEWLDGVETNIPTLQLATLYPILDLYDFLHRLAYGYAPKNRLCETYGEVIFQTWLKGDRSISEMDIMFYLKRQLSKNPIHLPAKRIGFFFSKLNDWINESHHSGYFPETTLADAFKKASLLLQSDLSPFISDQQEYKNRLFSTYLPFLTDLEGLDSQTLKAMFTFLRDIGPRYITPEQDYFDRNSAESYRINLLRQLSNATDLNQYDRMAYTLDLIHHPNGIKVAG